MAALGLDLFQADHDLQEQRNVSSDSGAVVGLAQGIGFHIQGVEPSDGDLLSGELSQGELPDVAAGAVDRIISFWHSQRQAVLKNKQLIVNTFECRLINMPLAASNIFLELP